METKIEVGDVVRIKENTFDFPESWWGSMGIVINTYHSNSKWREVRIPAFINIRPIDLTHTSLNIEIKDLEKLK